MCRFARSHYSAIRNAVGLIIIILLWLGLWLVLGFMVWVGLRFSVWLVYLIKLRDDR